MYHKELIGKEIKLLESKNQHQRGWEGRIIDETKSTIKLEVGKEEKTLFKNNILFLLKKENLIIKGQEINKRPEERIK